MALAEIIDIKKSELENIRQSSTIGSTIHARTQWLNEGELFCSLESINMLKQ